jgi:hypothetical protein
MTSQEMARADERREQAAAARAVRERKQLNEQLARLAAGSRAPTKAVPLAKADLITGLERQLEATRKAQERLALFLQWAKAIEGEITDPQTEETRALTGKGLRADEWASIVTHSRSIQLVLQADLAEHEHGKEDVVVAVRAVLVALNRLYQSLFGRELGARIEKKKRELAATLDPEMIAEVQAGLGVTSAGIPRGDALEHLARKSKPIRTFCDHRPDWPQSPREPQNGSRRTRENRAAHKTTAPVSRPMRASDRALWGSKGRRPRRRSCQRRKARQQMS